MIVLFTATGAENLGDELITLCEIRYFQSMNEEITLFSHDVERTRRFLLSQKISLADIIIKEYFPNALRKHPFKNIKFSGKQQKSSEMQIMFMSVVEDFSTAKMKKDIHLSVSGGCAL
jgi:hypothetical protein